MKILRLAVQRFQCIESAELELGPGLNVLYGPNDLGKSSLAWAIRAVLLLQPSSAQHERFVSWYGGGEPRVALTFADDEERYWRVTKSFGATTGRSTLETSKDGRTWTPDAAGRQVDEKLRAMMRWGIPAPGGSGGSRGLPESFLTQVLLAEQDSVREVLFGGNVANDPDESGRQRLVEALGALAQDPLFKQVLDAAQERVDEAFTPKGNRKRGAGSPFKDISDRVKDLTRERDELVGKRRDAEAVESRIRQLAAERDEASEQYAEMKAELAAAEQEFVVERQRAQLQARIAEQETIIRGATAREREISEAKQVVAAAEGKLAEAARKIAAAQAASEKAEREREAARGELDRVAHGDDRAKGPLEEAVRVAQEALVAAQTEERRAAEALAKTRELARSIEALEAERAALATSRAGRERELWIGVALAAVGRLRAEEQALRAKLPKQLPSPSALAELRELREAVRIAEAKLEVGLAVAIRPKKAIAVKTRRDGGKETSSKGSDAKTISAKRSIALSIDDVVELEISAGDEAAREELAELAARWEKVGGALLAKYGVDSLEELDKLRAQTEEATKAADERRRSAEAIERWTASVDPPELDEDDEAEVVSRLAKLKADVAGKLTERLAELEKSAADGSKALVLETKIATLRAQLSPPKHSAKTAAEAEQRRLAAKTAHDEAVAKLAAHVRERATAIETARDRLAKAETLAKQARTAADTLAAQSRQSSELFNQLKLQLAELVATQAATNIDAARVAIAALQPELAALGPSSELEETDVEHMRQSFARAERRLRDTEAELHRARGALEQVGGAIVRERQRELDDAIALAEVREHEIAIEYDAWKLLVETMRESEATEGAHLGKALGGPVSKRFAELTGGRYGALELGANLESAGLHVAGALRDPAALSAGTQDQLATLLRLCVAEQLKSTIVLDDHLAQSDLRRVGWFNEVLRDAAKAIQIVLITCRPGELLAASELPTGTDATRNLAGGRVRAIDLSRVIQRYPGRA